MAAGKQCGSLIEFTAYDLLLVLLVLGASLAVRGIAASAGASMDDSWPAAVLHGSAMALIVVIAFYYSDLYAVDQTLSVHELLHRFVAGLGLACIVIGIISYPIPNFGKSINISEMIVMGISLAPVAAWIYASHQAGGDSRRVKAITTAPR